MDGSEHEHLVADGQDEHQVNGSDSEQGNNTLQVNSEAFRGEYGSDLTLAVVILYFVA